MERLNAFLQKHWDKKSPLLLGLSGGTDSRALLHALLDSQVPFHIAHVDHGWRPESGEESEILRKEAESLGLPFHTIRLCPGKQGNLEADAREKRLLFFQSLFETTPFQALLLAQHQDDLAETVLKRVFEGAHLPFLGGMKEVSQQGSMTIWRPLLSTPRKEILRFLEERKISFFDDPTNRDPKFLRSRTRLEIIPYLNETFGKNISENLSLLGERAFELKEYLDQKVSPHPFLKGPWGTCFDLNPLERIEKRHLLQKFISLPRSQIEEIVDAQRTDWHLSPHLFLDRGWVFLLNPSPPRFGDPVELKVGSFQSGDWKVVVERGGGGEKSDWKKVWSGHFSASAKGERLSLCLPPPGTGLKKVWSEKKVPPFLRFQVPVLSEKGGIFHEFLSGKGSPINSSSLKISFAVSSNHL